MSERERPDVREHDHLVEPLFGGLRGAGEREAEREEAPILERTVPSWWLWVSVLAILAAALWLT